ncbi:MAG: hypothetical protein M3162_09065 [Thermoproteota archaeon]|nr:hypothetical protein [Thermoproteota archaeon]
MFPITEKVDNINEGIVYFLSRFIACKFLSSYEIYDIERQVKPSIQYRSVNKKVHTLDEMGLITRITNPDQLTGKPLGKGARYYTITEIGLFILYRSYKTYLPQLAATRNKKNGKIHGYLIDISRETIFRFREYEFYRLFLFHWLTDHTIKNCSTQLIEKINDALSNICALIEKTVMQATKQSLFTTIRDLNNINPAEYNSYKKAVQSLQKNEKEFEDEDKGRRGALPTGSGDFFYNISDQERSIFSRQFASLWNVLGSFKTRSIYHRMVFLTLIDEEIKDKDKELLRNDSKFREWVYETNSKLRNNSSAFL